MLEVGLENIENPVDQGELKENKERQFSGLCNYKVFCANWGFGQFMKMEPSNTQMLKEIYKVKY